MAARVFDELEDAKRFLADNLRSLGLRSGRILALYVHPQSGMAISAE